jgi:hypothetical protein
LVSHIYITTPWGRSAGIISRLKNTVGWFFVREKYYSDWKNKLNKMDYKPDEQGPCLMNLVEQEANRGEREAPVPHDPSYPCNKRGRIKIEGAWRGRFKASCWSVPRLVDPPRCSWI